MTARLAWTVHGLPAPQGSARAFLHRSTRRVIVTHDCGRVKSWRQEVASELSATLCQAEHWPPHIRGSLFPRPPAVSLRATFYLPRPKSAPKKNRHARHPA